MSQTSYDIEQAKYFAGMKKDGRFDEVLSRRAGEEIPFGRGVGSNAGDVDSVFLPKKDVATLVFDADFVTSNAINLSVNGVAITEVDFTTDHDTTAGLVNAAIDALTGVTSVLDSTDTNNRTFIIESDSVAIALSGVAVTGGATQAGSAVTYSGNDVFRGISIHIHNEDGKYTEDEMVSVGSKAEVIVSTSVAVTADQTAYVDLAAGDGTFTNVATGNLATGGKFTVTNAAAGLSAVVINLP